MNWYAKYKQAKALPETIEPYPENKRGGLHDVDSYLTNGTFLAYYVHFNVKKKNKSLLGVIKYC